MSPRPELLASRPIGETGAELIAAFQQASEQARRDTDRWLLVNRVYGSLTWQEEALYCWIEDQP